MLTALASVSLSSVGVPVLIEGDVRVEALSDSLVRIELKGPKGFEDRETLRILRRDWPGCRFKVARNPQMTVLDTGAWKVLIPAGAKSLTGVKVVDRKGADLYRVTGSETARTWLPAPAKVGRAWSFADAPRIIPPAWGATPAANNDPSSGWDLGNNARDLYVFLPNRSYNRLRRDFLRLTGPAEMPPLFMLGLIDSKYHPYTDAEALDRVDQYRRRQIPLDVLTIDTDWRTGGSHGYKPDPKYFPDMPGFMVKAKAKGVRLMFNDHPEPQAETALDPKEMNYRWQGISSLLAMGLDVWWYDRNWWVGLKEPAPGLAGHVWGMRVYHDMTERARPNERPVIMANTDGIDNGLRNGPPDVTAHRFSVQWTGDTSSLWSYLKRAVGNAVQGGVEGLNPWINDDLGGHVGAPADDLYVRFMQYGSLSPIMRPHCTRGYDRAPWTFGPEAERIVGDYVRLRYRLLPLLYASARDSYDTGEPIVRRLDLDYPQYAEAAREDEYLLGQSLLVAPIVDGGPQRVGTDAFIGPWKAQYYANEQLSGEPVLTRDEADPGFDLTDAAVAPGVPADHFSARWVGKVSNRSSDPLRLTVTTDDGVRVWVDGKLAVDKWEALNSVTNVVPFTLAPGTAHDVRIEYMELTGGALMRLGMQAEQATSKRGVWLPPGTWTNLWTGEVLQGPNNVTVETTLEQIPLFAKAGGVIPTIPLVQKTPDIDWKEIRLDVFAGADGRTSLYEDDGHSVAYRKGAFRHTAIVHRSTPTQATIQVLRAKGKLPGAVNHRSYVVRYHLAAGTVAKSATVNGFNAAMRVLPRRSRPGMPFQPGAAADGAVVEIRVPSVSVSKGATVAIQLARS